MRVFSKGKSLLGWDHFHQTVGNGYNGEEPDS